MFGNACRMAGEIEVYLGLGSNIGDRKSFIDKALALLDAEESIRIDAVSDIIETEPWGFASDSCFMNCAARIYVKETLTPYDLMAICKNIEKSLGRNENIEFDESGKRIYHSREIDIDILLYGKQRLDDEKLKIPHTLMTSRDFVMIPLRQIASDNIIEAFPEIFQQR